MDGIAESCREAPKGLLKSIRLTGATGYGNAILQSRNNQTMNAGFDEETHGASVRLPWASTKGSSANILVGELAIVKLVDVKTLVNCGQFGAGARFVFAFDKQPL